MNKDEFLGKVADLLACLPDSQVEESRAFLSEAIDDRMEDGMSEEEAVTAMGSPGSVAEAILDDLPAVPRAIARTKRRSTVLLWTLAIVGSPVWASLGLAFVALAVAVYICIWAMALCVWVLAVATGAAAVAAFALIAAGVAVGNIPYVIAMLGCGCFAAGITVFIGLGAAAVTRRIARLSVLWVRRAVSPFRKSGGDGSWAAASRDGFDGSLAGAAVPLAPAPAC